MTTLNANQKEFAMALYDATLTGKPLEEKDWKSVVEDDETAYAVQDEVMRLKGVPVGGYKPKICLTLIHPYMVNKLIVVFSLHQQTSA